MSARRIRNKSRGSRRVVTADTGQQVKKDLETVVRGDFMEMRGEVEIKGRKERVSK